MHRLMVTDVMQEAMRVLPVASTGTSRVTKADMVIGGHLIPGNSFIVVPFDAVHHWAGNWPDQPHAFIPVRRPAQPCRVPEQATPALAAAYLLA